MDNSFKNLIEASNSVVILLPSNPNLDEVAAGLSLYLSLNGKKEVGISCPTPMIVEHNRLVGVNKVSPDLGNKNLTIRFRDYEATDIERVSYDIDNGQFKLTVIPKPGITSPKKEQVDLSYSGVAGDLVVLIGGTTGDSFPALSSKDLASSKIAHVGIKALNMTDSAILSFARPASSVSQIIYSMVSEVAAKVDSDTATNLLAGIEDASNGFKGEGVTAETFEIMAHLLKLGGARMPRIQDTNRSFPAGSIPGAQLFTRESDPEKKEDPNAPQDWLEPKVFKGTSVS